MRTILFVILCAVAAAGPAAGEVFCGGDPGLPAAAALEEGWDALVTRGDLAAAAALFEGVDQKANSGAALWMGLETVAGLRGRPDEAFAAACAGITAARHTPWAEVFIHDALNIRSRAAAIDPLPAALAVCADDPTTAPAVRDLARFALVTLLDEAGDRRGAAARVAELGFLTRGLYCGPFPNRDNAGFDEPYPPETTVDLAGEYPGLNRTVRWTPWTTPLAVRTLDYSAVFYPYDNAVGYGLYAVQVDEAGDYMVHAGTGNPVRIWVNWEMAFADSSRNGLFFDRHVFRTALVAGWNIILVKLATTAEDGEWSLYLRVTRPDGTAVPGLREELPAAAMIGSGVISGRIRTVVPEPSPAEAFFGEVRGRDPGNSVAAATLGYVYGERAWGDAARKEALALYKEALRLAPDCPLWGQLVAAADEDVNNALPVLMRAIAHTPDAPALKEDACALLVHRGFGREFEDRAVAWFAGVPDATPPYITWLKAGLCRDRKWYGEAQVLYRETVRRMPRFMPARRMAARNTLDLSEEEAGLAAILALVDGDRAALERMGDIQLVRGDWRGAAEWFTRLIERHPLHRPGYDRLAGVYMDRREYDKALSVYDRAAAVMPQHPGLVEARGKVEILAGRTEAGQAAFAAALETDPNQAALKEYAEFLAPAQDAFYAAWDFDGTAERTAYAPAVDLARFNTVDIRGVEVVQVLANGTENRMVHRLQKVLTEAGTGQLATVSVPFKAGAGRVDVKYARVIKADGTVAPTDDIRERGVFNTGSGGATMYSSYRVVNIGFPGLAAGDAIEYLYVLKATEPDLFSDAFSDVSYLAGMAPAGRLEYVVSVPAAMRLRVGAFNGAAEPRIIKDEAAGRWTYRWELNGWGGIVPERSMRPVTELLPYVVVSTMAAWDEVGRWFQYLVKDQFHLNQEMRDLVRTRTAGAATPTARAEALFRYVIDEIRYVGIELGRGSYKPHRAESTFATRYGDCKDTAVLMAALFREAGIPAEVVLVRTVTQGGIDPGLASPYLFNHAICRIPDLEGRTLWLDGTTDFYRMEELPWADQGALALVVSDKGGTITTIPSEAASTTGVKDETVITLREDGGADLVFTERAFGQRAPMLRSTIHSPDRFRQLIERYFSRKYPGLQIGAVTTSDPEGMDPVPWFTVTGVVPRFALRQGAELLLATAVSPVRLSGGLREDTRTYDLWLQMANYIEEEVRINLPAGWRVKLYPQERTMEVPNAAFRHAVIVTDAVLTYASRFGVTATTVKAGDYLEYKSFCARVDAAQEERIILEKE
ncbi:MAG: DUF3857 domain-containing protein [Planctomycetota bacterium]